MKIEDLKEEYLYNCENGKRLSRNSLRSYRFVLQQFLEWAALREKNEIESITPGDVREYLAWLNGRYAPAAARHHFTCISTFFSYACECEYLEMSPFLQVRAHIRSPRRLPRSITRGDLQKLLDTARKQLQEEYDEIIKDSSKSADGEGPGASAENSSDHTEVPSGTAAENSCSQAEGPAGIRTSADRVEADLPELMSHSQILERSDFQQNSKYLRNILNTCRSSLLLELLLRTGLRIQELCDVRMRDLDPACETVLILGKG